MNTMVIIVLVPVVLAVLLLIYWYFLWLWRQRQWNRRSVHSLFDYIFDAPGDYVGFVGNQVALLIVAGLLLLGYALESIGLLDTDANSHNEVE